MTVAGYSLIKSIRILFSPATEKVPSPSFGNYRNGWSNNCGDKKDALSCSPIVRVIQGCLTPMLNQIEQIEIKERTTVASLFSNNINKLISYRKEKAFAEDMPFDLELLEEIKHLNFLGTNNNPFQFDYY